MNEEEQQKTVEKRAVLISTAVMLYIIAVVAVIIGALIGNRLNNEDVGAEIGVIIMFVIAAVATGRIVYANMSVSKQMPHNTNAPVNSTAQKQDTWQVPPTSGSDGRSANGAGEFSAFSSLMKLYWLVVTIVYLGLSFLTRAWYITWLIWLIAAAVEQGIKIIHMLTTNKSGGDK